MKYNQPTGFNDTEHLLTPADYPASSMPDQPDNGGPPVPSDPSVLMGTTIDRNEAIILFFCTPPPAEYFGLTSYVFNRVLFNETESGQGDTNLIVHMPVAEVSFY